MEDPEHREVGLMGSMFQNMFPSIDVNAVKLNSIRRCVLISRDAETGKIDFRQVAKWFF